MRRASPSAIQRGRRVFLPRPKPFGMMALRWLELVVDPNEPPLPGQIKLEQQSILPKHSFEGQKDTKEIVKTIIEDNIREMI